MKILSINSWVFLSLFLLGSVYSSHSQNGRIEVNQDPEINKLLALKKEINNDENSNGKYRIQIYSGNRIGAEKAKTGFGNKFSEFKSSLVYETPNYKIWIGNFKTRLEADRALVDVQKEFPSAFIFKPKIKE